MGATIKDIAKKTGLGLATISKYLNGGNVLEKNRISIEAAIEELNFQVNEMARGLKTNKSKTVGVVIPKLNNQFMSSIAVSMEETLREKGYGVIVCDTGGSPEREMEVIDFLLRKVIDGIIILPSDESCKGADKVKARKIPMVFVDRKVSRMEHQADTVVVDNCKAAQETTQYLIDQGHRKIALIVGNESIYTSKQRILGYCAALSENSIPIRRELIKNGNFTVEGGFQAVNQLLQEEKITAVFATNFEMTLGSLLLLNEKGKQVPGDVSLIGFDNPDLAKAMHPALTVVVQPTEEMGARAATLLLERMEGSEEPFQELMLDTRLQRGASVSNKKKKGE